MEENGLNVRKLQRTEENSNELKKLATNWRNWQSYGRHVAIDRRRKRGIKLKRNCLPSDCSNAVYPWSLRETWTSPSELTRDRRVSLFWLIATFKRKTFFIYFFIYFHLFKQTVCTTILTTNICDKMYIQYIEMGCEPTTFRRRVSSHNH